MSAKERKMTAREKAERARIRKELRAEGLLPPIKKPLNHRRFCEEGQAALEEPGFNRYEALPYLLWGLAEMMCHGGYDKEAVGAAKAVRLAKGRMDFEEKRAAEGQTGSYKVGELYEAVKDIYDA